MFGSLVDTVAARARRRPLGLAGVTAGALLAAVALISLLRPADAVAQPLEAGGAPIVSLALLDGDAVVAQTEPQDGVVDQGHGPVELLAITVVDYGAQQVKLVPRPGPVDVVDVGYPADSDRIAASENGAGTPATTAGFEVAAERVLASSDLRDYLRSDDPERDGAGWGHDLDVTFDRPLTGDQFVVISERNGNSSLRLTALDESALPFATGRPVVVEPPYAWNTGYAPGDTNPAQPFHLTVIDVDTLLASTATAEGVEPTQTISGLRFETDDGADVNVTVFVDETSAAATADRDAGDPGPEASADGAALDVDALLALASVTPPGSPGIAALGSVYPGHDGGAGCATAQPFVEAEQGTALTYCVTVTNTGSTPLVDLAVTAPLLPVGFAALAPAADPGRLDPGSSVVFFVEAAPPPDAADGDVDDTSVTTVSAAATAEGTTESVAVSTDILAFPAGDEEPIAPQMALAVSTHAGTDGGVCTDAASPVADGDSSATAGGEQTRCYVVTNTGNTHLGSIEILDPGLGAPKVLSGLATGMLAPGRAAVFANTAAGVAGGGGTAGDASATVTANAVDGSGSDLVGLADVTATAADRPSAPGALPPEPAASASAVAAEPAAAAGPPEPAASAAAAGDQATQGASSPLEPVGTLARSHDGAAGHQPPTELAFTGWETTIFALLGVALMAAGGVLLHPAPARRVALLAVGCAGNVGQPVRDYFDR